jgi:hypothetical protein
MAQGPQKRSRTTKKSTRLTEEIVDTTETASSGPQIRRRRGIFVTLITQKRGVRSIAPQGMIWRSAKLFCIARRCHHQQLRWPRNPVGANIVRPILLTTMSRWERST